MDTTHINNIKKKLKEDYNFIKNDGNILNSIARELLTENDNDYQKTLEFIDTLSKKDIQNRMQKIMNDLETAGEISSLVKETIKKDNLKLDKLKQSLEGLENEYSELEDSKTELEKSIKDLEHNLELKQAEITSKIQFEQDKYDSHLAYQKDKHDSHLASLENILTEKKIDLADIQNTLDSVFQNGYENEFDFTECDYIIKEPVIHLNLDTALKSIYGITRHFIEYKHEIKQKRVYEPLNKNHINPYALCNLGFSEKKILFNFPINIKLNDNEIIIKSFINNNFIETIGKSYNLIYITNFGRFITTNSIIIINDERDRSFTILI